MKEGEVFREKILNLEHIIMRPIKFGSIIIGVPDFISFRFQTA